MPTTPKTKKRSLVKKFQKDEQQIDDNDINNNNNKKLKTKKTEKPQSPPPQPQQQLQNSDSGSDSDSDSDSDSNSLTELLEPYTKDGLIDLIANAALKLPSLSNHIRHVADRDVSHRKIFVHGLGWDTTRETLLAAFESFGGIEDCNVVTDKATGKAKGYGFVLFNKRKSALKALENPKKKIGNRFASCQLASVGPVAPLAQSQAQDASSRRIYVSNVPPETESEKLRQFFAKFGQIETGPIGFDSTTGKSRGFALIVYKTEAGAKKVLEDPYKSFEGHRIHCRKATEGKGKNPVQQTQPPPPLQPPQPLQQQQTQGSVLAAMAAAQNLAMFGHHPSLNPMYSGFMANPGAALLANPMGHVGGAQSVLGAYGTPGTGLHPMYPNTQMGQPSASRGQGPSGYSSYMWYDRFQFEFLYLISLFIIHNFSVYACLVLIFAKFINITKSIEVKIVSSDSNSCSLIKLVWLF
ncbi:UBP1-associated protein 2B-like [Fagus crenata]